MAVGKRYPDPFSWARRPIKVWTSGCDRPLLTVGDWRLRFYLCMGTERLGACFLGHCGNNSASCSFLLEFSLCFRPVGISVLSFCIQLGTHRAGAQPRAFAHLLCLSTFVSVMLAIGRCISRCQAHTLPPHPAPTGG